MGEMAFDDLYKAFREQVIACEKGGADLISIETMIDIGEMRAALIAARENTRLPVIAHMTFENNRTMTGN
jgi:5-methyltetrahydrofolate--homocysteine methyltransferase